MPPIVITKPETNENDVVMTEDIIISEINNDDSKIEEVEHRDTSPKPISNEETDSDSKVGSVFHRIICKSFMYIMILVMKKKHLQILGYTARRRKDRGKE